eukprot:365784-Chlamydomonas_euryale.AAC.6
MDVYPTFTVPMFLYGCEGGHAHARSNAEDDRVEQLKLQGHKPPKCFLTYTALQSRDAMQSAAEVAPHSKKRRWNLPWPGRPGVTLLENLAPFEFKKPRQVGRILRPCTCGLAVLR